MYLKTASLSAEYKFTSLITIKSKQIENCFGFELCTLLFNFLSFEAATVYSVLLI